MKKIRQKSRFARGIANGHPEGHRTETIGWLRAAVLGANDGIVSTASLVLGVVAAGVEHRTILLTGISGLIAGAMSMAAGEFVSVHSQADTERADLARERTELQLDPAGERDELTAIYVGRGLDRPLAEQVANRLMAHDALGSHARDELGLSEVTAAQPMQAAMASAASFAVGAVLPIAVVVLAGEHGLTLWVGVSSVLFLAALGAVAAWAGGAGVLRSALRVAFWGAAAMLVTDGAGRLFAAVA